MVAPSELLDEAGDGIQTEDGLGNLLLESEYASLCLSYGPQAYWRANEASGDLYDLVSGKVLLAQSVAATYGVPSALADISTGIAASAVSDSGFQMAVSDTALQNGDGPWTVVVWAKKVSHGGSTRRVIATKGTAWSLVFYGDKFSVEPDTTPSHEESTASADGRWRMYAVTRGGGAASTNIYRDAVDVTTIVNDAFSYSNSANVVSLGQYHDGPGTLPLDGAANDLAFFNKVLTAGELLDLYKAGVGAYEYEVLLDAPAVHYRLGEAASAALVIDTLGRLNGTRTNAPTSAFGPFNDLRPATGFNGTDEYDLVLDNALIDFGDTFTYEFWVRRTSLAVSAEPDLVTKGSQGQVGFNASDRVHFDNDGSVCSTSSVAVADIITWHHVVCTRGSSVDKIYLDNADVTVAGTLAARASSATNLNIGRYHTGSEYAAAEMAQVALYPTVLAPARVTAHWVAGGGAVAGVGGDGYIGSGYYGMAA